MESAEVFELIEQYLLLSHRNRSNELDRRERRRLAILREIFVPRRVDGAGFVRRPIKLRSHYRGWLGTPSRATEVVVTRIRCCDVELLAANPPFPGLAARLSIEAEHGWHHFRGRVLSSRGDRARVSLEAVLPDYPEIREPAELAMGQ